ncbi:MAG: hypothetical protein ALECFALPRED_006711 [Alectoria fallacina]|uniref:F-box domain-containing protein n=1 Tax=Alectoria fallacina TaxID=1903189 RepID=A0A8H3G401_9LECA|nr:MAG: hypothetical protein ALECFALPRED_006711 [Alectoria fallacina]
MTSTEGLRRSSRLARGAGILSAIADSALSPPKTGSPYLPAEVKGLVAECLQKSDLKSLRYVSKQWHAMATPSLFDRVYISPRDKDIQVFSNVTKHPVLRSSVKELICDISEIPELSHEEYFYDLCDELRYITASLSTKHPFNSPHPRLNNFVNAIIRDKMTRGVMFSKHANDRLVVEGYQLWQELAVEERQNLKVGSHGIFFSDLCSGLLRLPNLQSVKMDDDIWDKTRMDNSTTFLPIHPDHTPSTVLSGSPLARSLNPWHLRPKRSEDAGFENLSLMVRALSRTKKTIKHFECQSRHPRIHKGLSPGTFARYNITQSFPRHMAIALCHLESLKLQITPHRYELLDHEDAKALGFLPQLLEQMTGLNSLSLILLTAERVKKQRRLSLTPLHDACFNLSQVFSHHGKWQHLEHLYLAGLAMHGLDMFFLLFHQMPRLLRLWLNRIDLLEGSWDGVVEILRCRGACMPWELLSLQGSFRHNGDHWWPCTPDYGEELLALRSYSIYAQEGGHHPSLPAESEDSLSFNYFNDMINVATSERVQELRLRLQQAEAWST